MPTRLYSDVQMLDHQPGDGHPERPARLAALLHGLRERPVPGTSWHAAREATETELLRAHGERHLRLLQAADGQSVSLDPDTHTSPDSVQVARLAAGATIQAAESALAGVPAFALVLWVLGWSMIVMALVVRSTRCCTRSRRIGARCRGCSLSAACTR